MEHLNSLNSTSFPNQTGILNQIMEKEFDKREKSACRKLPETEINQRLNFNVFSCKKELKNGSFLFLELFLENYRCY